MEEDSGSGSISRCPRRLIFNEDGEAVEKPFEMNGLRICKLSFQNM